MIENPSIPPLYRMGSVTIELVQEDDRREVWRFSRDMNLQAGPNMTIPRPCPEDYRERTLAGYARSLGASGELKRARKRKKQAPGESDVEPEEAQEPDLRPEIEPSAEEAR